MIELKTTLTEAALLQNGSLPDLPKAVEEGVRPIMTAVVNTIREGTPNESIKAGWQEGEPERGADSVTLTAYNTHPAAAYYTFGTRPHNIPRAFGKDLPFGTGGRFDGYFHPGTPSHDAVTQTWADARSEFEQAANGAVLGALRKAFG